MTSNCISDFGNAFGLSSGMTFTPWFQRDPSFLFQCNVLCPEQTTCYFPQSTSTLPTLESLDAAFSINIDEEIPPSNFSLSELTQIALSALNKESLSDVQVLAYGYSNKVYSLTFSDGTEAVVRIPHVDWKGVHWLGRLLETEVATMKYAKRNLPPEFAALVPDVYAWDSDPKNPVGQQYTIMEKMKGVPFSDAWHDATNDQKRYVAEYFARLTHALYSTGNEFTEFGSLYFDSQSDSFHVGPYINRDYELNRHNPTVDNGPWTNSSDCFLEQLKSRLLFFSSTLDETAEDNEYYSLIIKHLQNLGFFVSDFEASIINGVQRDFTHHSLFHTDLHAKNFLVDPTTMQVTGILDWEGMGIFPDWISISIPAFLETQKLSTIWNLRDTSRIEEISTELESLREWYLLERNRLQPGYSNQVAGYLKLYKLYNAIFVEPEDVEGTTFEWIEKELENRM